jgi:hypothetical protein
MEATIDPALTLGRDILPRFQKTSKYTKMNAMLEDLTVNNRPEDLTVPYPPLPTPPLPIDDPNYQYSLEVELPSCPLLPLPPLSPLPPSPPLPSFRKHFLIQFCTSNFSNISSPKCPQKVFLG